MKSTGSQNKSRHGKKASEGVVEVKIKATGDTIEVNADNLIETLAILTTEQDA